MIREMQEALDRLLWELPGEFREPVGSVEARNEFRVIKQSNVRKVHAALYELQELAGMIDEKVCKCGKPMRLHRDSRDENLPFNAIISHPGTDA